MDREQHYEWQRMHQTALAALRDEPRAACLVRLLVLPALAMPCAYEVLDLSAPVRDRDCNAHLRSWDVELDQQKLATPVDRMRWPRELAPTLRWRMYHVPPAGVDAVLGALRELRLPPEPGPGPTGLDGVCYELSCGSGLHRATFCWWMQPPPGWAALGPLARAIVNLFEAGAVLWEQDHVPRRHR